MSENFYKSLIKAACTTNTRKYNQSYIIPTLHSFISSHPQSSPPFQVHLSKMFRVALFVFFVLMLTSSLFCIVSQLISLHCASISFLLILHPHNSDTRHITNRLATSQSSTIKCSSPLPYK